MNTPQVKSGFKSSEFYLSIVTSGAGMLIALGVLKPEDADLFIQGIVAIIGGVMTIAPIVVYIVGRINLKKEAARSGTITPSMPISTQVENMDATPEFYPR